MMSCETKYAVIIKQWAFVKSDGFESWVSLVIVGFASASPNT